MQQKIVVILFSVLTFQNEVAPGNVEHYHTSSETVDCKIPLS